MHEVSSAKLRKKQPLAELEMYLCGRHTMDCTLGICESSSFRPAVPNLAYMHPQVYICLSEGVYLFSRCNELTLRLKNEV